jgi:hypothetical protein
LPTANADDELMRAKILLLHEEATRKLSEDAPTTARSYLVTAVYVEAASQKWDLPKVQDVLLVADHVSSVRKRQHLIAAFAVVLIAALIGFFSSTVPKLLDGNADKITLLQFGVGGVVFVIANEFVGKFLFVEPVRERREKWRSAVASLLKRKVSLDD